MTFRIPRGKHRARPFRFAFWWNKIIFTWKVSFTESCRYSLNSPDQGDYNKLIGVGYLPHHHYESARFGWRYIADIGQIEVAAYCYLSGRRISKTLAFCEIGKEYRLELFCLNGSYHFSCCDTAIVKPVISVVDIIHGHRKKLQYRLGTFFGGNQKAPHEIKIQLDKV
jgi:hypothetical protein